MTFTASILCDGFQWFHKIRLALPHSLRQNKQRGFRAPRQHAKNLCVQLFQCQRVQAQRKAGQQIVNKVCWANKGQGKDTNNTIQYGKLLK